MMTEHLPAVRAGHSGRQGEARAADGIGDGLALPHRLRQQSGQICLPAEGGIGKERPGVLKAVQCCDAAAQFCI